MARAHMQAKEAAVPVVTSVTVSGFHLSLIFSLCRCQVWFWPSRLAFRKCNARLCSGALGVVRACVRVCACVCVYTLAFQGTVACGAPSAGAGSARGAPGAGGADTASPLSPDDRICSPPFMELTSLCGDDTMQLLEKNGLAFPFSAYCPGRGPAGGRPWLGRPGPRPLGGEGSGAPPPGRAAAVQPTRGRVLAPAPTCPFPRGAAGVFELPALPGWALWGRTSLTALFFSPPPPTVCKTRVAHGTNSHEMAIVFNQEGLSAIQPPCVVQNFINHNAVLYKVFVVGESYTVVQRPSLKNFSAGTSDRESIFFNSHNVSKPESSSVLTALDKIEGVFERPSDEVIRALSRALRQALGVSLFGIDIIINNQTGQHAVIDINAFPGYEGVSEFFTDLLNHIASVLQGQSAAAAASGDVAPLRHSKLLAEQAGGLAAERTCSASPGCCSSMMGQEPPWTSEADVGGVGAGSTAKLPHQRLGCTAAVSPSFQQHCVASLATKASSQ
uniref:inositol-1,3,4-trisphosphate 5/6-kinase n=1 Tax=Sus scrofa TaxID=9823 RepID=A0A8D1ETK0_PIG